VLACNESAERSARSLFAIAAAAKRHASSSCRSSRGGCSPRAARGTLREAWDALWGKPALSVPATALLADHVLADSSINDFAEFFRTTIVRYNAGGAAWDLPDLGHGLFRFGILLALGVIEFRQGGLPISAAIEIAIGDTDRSCGWNVEAWKRPTLADAAHRFTRDAARVPRLPFDGRYYPGELPRLPYLAVPHLADIPDHGARGAANAPCARTTESLERAKVVAVPVATPPQDGPRGTGDLPLEPIPAPSGSALD
jgi:hypothetical protein